MAKKDLHFCNQVLGPYGLEVYHLDSCSVMYIGASLVDGSKIPKCKPELRTLPCPFRSQKRRNGFVTLHDIACFMQFDEAIDEINDEKEIKY